jgi:hypothetical protein
MGIVHCYYVDMSNGSDLNSGADENHPWAHTPEMTNATGNAATHIVIAGDGYIFKGGSVCGSSCFPITILTSGNSSHPIYYGFDPQWGTGRPAFKVTGKIASANVLVNLGTAVHRMFDNFDVSGLTDNNDDRYQHNVMFLANGDYNAFTRNYLHGWNTNGSRHDEMVGFHGCNGCSGGNQSNSVWDRNYCNGADAVPPSTRNGQGSFECFRYNGGGTVTDNVVRNVSNGDVFGAAAGALVCGNDWGFIWTSYDASSHENIFEFQTGNNVICNNLYHDTAGTGVWPMPLAPAAGMTDWVFNNICWNVGRDCVSIDTQAQLTDYTANLINNTWIPAHGSYCADTTDRGTSYAIGRVNLINNLCITDSGTSASSFCFNHKSPICSGVLALNETTNTLLTTSKATSQGHTSLEAFAYSPTAPTNATVGAGTNVNSLATGSVAALASDTGYACSVNAANSVLCPTRTPVSRGGSCTPTPGVPGCWDAGAYMFVSSHPRSNQSGSQAMASDASSAQRELKKSN